ncbi:hypothetical protein [Fibrobacter sp.]|uniref:hypothetical protein n=1 Tax=Fibrobacter sp. TaxID=35828 RepID=UPI003867F033
MSKQACSRRSAYEVLLKASIKDDKCQGRVKQDCLQAYFRAQHLGAEGRAHACMGMTEAMRTGVVDAKCSEPRGAPKLAWA